MITSFTPIDALIGGVVLGTASILFLLFNGRIAGISSIVSGSFKSLTTQPQWRWCFVLGLIASPLLASQLGYHLPEHIDLSWAALIVGGFLVGFGSYYGSGCTSGHGICGIGRFSPRSIVATCIFMLVAVITVFIIKQF